MTKARCNNSNVISNYYTRTPQIVTILLLIATLPAFSDDLSVYNYQFRSNRYEGLLDIPRTSFDSLEVVSFTAKDSSVNFDENSVMNIRFYSSGAPKLRIVSTEIRRKGPSPYKMTPLQTAWPSGWQDFGPWPYSEVLAPLKIDPASLGVIIYSSEQEVASTRIIPSALYSDSYPPFDGNYEITFRSHNTLSSCEVSLIDEEDSKILGSMITRNIQAGVPFNISISLQQGGEYGIVLECQEYGRTSGPSRKYVFRHEPL